MASVLCSTPMCAQGRTSVQEMRNMFDTLVSAYTDFDRSRFEPTVVGIERSFNDAYSVFSEYVPFNPTCCTIQQIGAQADSVTAQMLKSVSAVSPSVPGPATASPGFSLPDFSSMGTGAFLALAVVAVLMFYKPR